ncbi:MAG: tRNA pseudouridine(55) synthase TruB [Pseudanabaenaceae cyanobacterium]
MLAGFLNLNKPYGLTAHDCVAQVRQQLGARRVGHAGTLDPMAVGVLPIAVGKYTRLLPFLQGDKSYRAVIQFGIVTDTDDITGRVLRQQSAQELTLAQIEPYLAKFMGTIPQRPPAYSAIHIGGKRLYQLARTQALPVEQIPLRTVTIHHLNVMAWQAGESPKLTIDIDCSTGTYIRSIARDLGEMLGCGATLAELIRTKSNGFRLEQSVTLGTIAFTPVDQVFAHLDRVELSADLLKKWQQGQGIPTPQTWHTPYLVTYDPTGQLVGISEYQAGRLLPKVVL